MCNLDRSHIVKPSLFRGGDTVRRAVGGGVVFLGGLSFPRLLAIDLIKFDEVVVAVGVLFAVGVRGLLGVVAGLDGTSRVDTLMALFAAAEAGTTGEGCVDLLEGATGAGREVVLGFGAGFFSTGMADTGCSSSILNSISPSIASSSAVSKGKLNSIGVSTWIFRACGDRLGVGMASKSSKNSMMESSPPSKMSSMMLMTTAGGFSHSCKVIVLLLLGGT
jgi:hypothetical protein